MPIEKLHPSYAFDQERLAQLRQVVPEAFADGRINWDVLREALGEYLEGEELEAEHYGLTWPGKREVRRLASLPARGSLLPVMGEGINENGTANLFIEGDNLQVLKLLHRSYAGKVKLIYIDPPYNTGNDFIYSDDFTESVEAYLQRTEQTGERGELLTSNPRAGGRFHSNWLNMMYPRLLLAKSLLREDGAIFVSIDDNEVHNLRQLLDEIFGPENFITCVIWQKVFAPKNTARHFSEDHDYIIVYARDAEVWRPSLLPRSQEAIDRYQNLDDDPRGPWASDNLLARNYYSKGSYTVTSPGGKQFSNPTGNYWRVAYEKFLDLNADKRIWWGSDGKGMPRLKRFLSEVQQGVVPQTLWKYEDVGHTQEAKQILLDYIEFTHTENVLNSVKPPRLIRRILQLATRADESDIILDFFTGSATTAHAVLEQNAEDNGNRQFIVVQIPEPLPTPETHLKTIADLGKTRIRNVIAKLNNDGQLPLQSSDLGFKVFRLGQSNFKEWNDYKGQAASKLGALFDRFEISLVEDWQEYDLFIEVMLQEGFPLHSTVTPQNQFGQNSIYMVESDFHAHRLFICLDKQFADETVGLLTLQPEDIFVCLDSALSDQSKVRLADITNLHVI